MQKIKKVKITPMTMILLNYADYYGTVGKLVYAAEVCALYEELGITYWGENTPLADFKASIGL